MNTERLITCHPLHKKKWKKIELVNWEVKFSYTFSAQSTSSKLFKQAFSPRPLDLPNLESLYLERFVFKDDDDEFYNSSYCFPEEPFSRLPNLEKLSLQQCRVTNLVICSSKLWILELFFKVTQLEETAKMKQISTPALTSLRY